MIGIGAGDLDRRIELQSATITNDPDYNTEIETWGTYATVSAKMEFHRADESEASAREYASMALFFTIRWRGDMSSEHRVIFEGETYEVIGQPREIGRRQFLKIEARRVEMSAVSLTIKALLAQAPVTAITGNRIYVLPMPPSTDLPGIAVALSAEDEEYMLAGSSQYPAATVQVHCLAEEAPDAIDLGEAVKVALRDLLFTSGSIKASFQKEAVDFTDYADDLSTHRRVMSFSIRWR